MSKLAIVFEDKDGQVNIGISILDGKGLPSHPRLFTNAHEVVNGVLTLLQQYKYPVKRLDELIQEQSSDNQ